MRGSGTTNDWRKWLHSNEVLIYHQIKSGQEKYQLFTQMAYKITMISEWQRGLGL